MNRFLALDRTHERVLLAAAVIEIRAVILLGTDRPMLRSSGRAQLPLDLSAMRSGAYLLDIALRKGDHHHHQLIIQ